MLKRKMSTMLSQTCLPFQSVSSISLNTAPKCFLFKFGFTPRNNFLSWKKTAVTALLHVKTSLLKIWYLMSLQAQKLELYVTAEGWSPVPNCSVQLLLSNPVRTWCVKLKLSISGMKSFHKFYTYIWFYDFKGWAV